MKLRAAMLLLAAGAGAGSVWSSIQARFGAGKWWGRFAVDVLAIAAALWACSWSLWLVPLAMLVIGSRLQAIGIVGHMAGHNNCGKYSKLLCALTFLPLGLSPKKYQAFHFAHHRHLGTDADPELAYIAQFRAKWLRPRLRDSLADLLGLNVHEFVAILKPIADAKSIALLLGFLGLLSLAIGPLIIVLLASYVTTLMCVFRLRYRAEHDHVGRPGHTFHWDKPSLWVRLLYLPHDHWRHAEHHDGVKGV